MKCRDSRSHVIGGKIKSIESFEHSCSLRLNELSD